MDSHNETQALDLAKGNEFELFDPIHGYLTAIARLSEKSRSRKAIKDHINSRLREEAKDTTKSSGRLRRSEKLYSRAYQSCRLNPSE